jgi:hypothetical protein
MLDIASIAPDLQRRQDGIDTARRGTPTSTGLAVAAAILGRVLGPEVSNIRAGRCGWGS